MTMCDEDSEPIEAACPVWRQIQSQVCPCPPVVTVALNRYEHEVSALQDRVRYAVFNIQIPRIEECQAVFVFRFLGEDFETIVVIVHIACDKQILFFFYS